MITLHLISHTHWDREWYLPFQVFRLKLVHLVDGLLDLLNTDPNYCHFMLDGQTIVLEDYLQMRPEREAELRAYVQSGRLLIGPWHVLPDEFLVSPEALVRNLLEGDRVSRRFGSKMQVGYIPDPFGHLAQMPQILRGFGISTACLQRGLSSEPCEFNWQAPDGSQVFLAYLRDGYGNGALLQAGDPDGFTAGIQALADSLAPHSTTPVSDRHLLLMFGNDHMEASPATSAAIQAANERLDGARLAHSTLPAYLDAVQTALQGVELPVVSGELRASQRHNLLPGVLSARVWIKQRNHACETLLEKWAEPFTLYAHLACPAKEELSSDGLPLEARLRNPAAILRQTWRLLLECHPHDSICGCSIDQVHDEMRPRFDQVEQIGEELVRQSLAALSGSISTQSAPPEAGSAFVVFNPSAGPRTDWVEVALPLTGHTDRPRNLSVVDSTGSSLACEVGEITTREIGYYVLSGDHLKTLIGGIQDGRITGLGAHSLALQGVRFYRQGEALHIDALLSEAGESDPETLDYAKKTLDQAFDDSTIHRFVLSANTGSVTLRMVAPGIPGHGYRTFWVRPADVPLPAPQLAPPGQPPGIENEFFSVSLETGNGTLTLTDKRSGAVFSGLNRFVDGGDRGDEYNYCPPTQDQQLSPRVETVSTRISPAQQTLEVTLVLEAPAGLTEDRQRRAAETVPLRITTRASLCPGVARLDFLTHVVNLARDHRLRVHFPAPFPATQADYDSHFAVLSRQLALPEFDSTWGEEPRPEKPQRAFTALSNGQFGLLLASRGLREAEARSIGDTHSEIALTLLRCVGWLSRDDLSNRKNHAGPGFPSPGAQMPGTWTFEYSAIPHTGDWRTAFPLAYAFDAPLRSLATGLHSGALPVENSFIQVSPPEFVLSAIKEADDGSGWIIRGCNLSDQTLQVVLNPWQAFLSASRVNLAEEIQAPLPQDSQGAIHIEARPHEIVTVRISTATTS